MEWTCPICTYVNPRNFMLCEICQTKRPSPKKKSVRDKKANYIYCNVCTYLNKPTVKRCKMCKTPMNGYMEIDPAFFDQYISCDKCTLVNKPGVTQCVACFAQILTPFEKEEIRRQYEIEAREKEEKRIYYASHVCVGASVFVITKESSTTSSDEIRPLRRKGMVSVMNNNETCDVEYDKDGSLRILEEDDIPMSRVILIPPKPPNISHMSPPQRLRAGKEHQEEGNLYFQLKKFPTPMLESFVKAEIECKTAIEYLNYAIARIPIQQTGPITVGDIARAAKKSKAAKATTTTTKTKTTTTTTTTATTTAKKTITATTRTIETGIAATTTTTTTTRSPEQIERLPKLYIGEITSIHKSIGSVGGYTYDILFEDDGTKRDNVPATELYSFDTNQREMLTLLANCHNTITKVNLKMQDLNGTIESSKSLFHKDFQPFLPRLRIYVIESFFLRSQALILSRKFSKAKSSVELALQTISAIQQSKKKFVDQEEKISFYKEQIEALKKEILEQEEKERQRLEAIEEEKKAAKLARQKIAEEAKKKEIEKKKKKLMEKKKNARKGSKKKLRKPPQRKQVFM